MRKGTKLPPRTPEHRRKLSDALRGSQHGAATFRKINAERRVVFDDVMTKELLRCRARGWNVEMLAAWIGVSRGVVMRELRARGLPTGRWRAA